VTRNKTTYNRHFLGVLFISLPIYAGYDIINAEKIE